MRGALVDVQEVKKLWSNVANTVVQNMMRLPSKISAQVYMVDNRDLVSGIIEKEIRDVLNAIADTPLPDDANPNAYGEEGEEED